MKNRANLNSNPLSRGPKRLSGLKQAVAAALALSLFVGTTGVAIAEAPMSAESPMALPDANLVIYRSGEANKTQSVNYRLYVDGKPVGKLRHNTAFPLSLSAGVHTVTLNDPDSTELLVEINANHTAIIRAEVHKRWQPTLAQENRAIDLAGMQVVDAATASLRAQWLVEVADSGSNRLPGLQGHGLALAN